MAKNFSKVIVVYYASLYMFYMHVASKHAFVILILYFLKLNFAVINSAGNIYDQIHQQFFYLRIRHKFSQKLKLVGLTIHKNSIFSL